MSGVPLRPEKRWFKIPIEIFVVHREILNLRELAVGLKWGSKFKRRNSPTETNYDLHRSLGSGLNHSLQGDLWRNWHGTGAHRFRIRWPNGYQKIAQFIRDASGMVLRTRSIQAPETRALITESIAEGRRLLVRLTSIFWSFLTLVASVRNYGNTDRGSLNYPTVSHSRLIEVARASSPRSFRNHSIVEGVQLLGRQELNATKMAVVLMPIIDLLSQFTSFFFEQTTDFPVSCT